MDIHSTAKKKKITTNSPDENAKENIKNEISRPQKERQ